MTQDSKNRITAAFQSGAAATGPVPAGHSGAAPVVDELQAG
ncbi:hypothetical protein [Arthrobacter sp. H14-L1]|nr:hypothetical protein [Arthrobacter sp. H14-L1]MCY0904217.1 hypothetical protein [Arthrobacter sp. H14-L1]